MAMYYYQGSSEIQTDGLQTLYLMNPNYLVMTSSSETQNHPHPNTPFFNPLHPPVSTVSPHAPLPQHYTGIPLSHDPIHPSPSQEHIRSVAHNAIPRFHYNIWGGSVDHHHHHHHQSDSGNNLNHPNTSPEQQQQQQRQQQTLKGLSLSLTPHQLGFDKSNIASENDHDFPVSSGSCPLDPNLTNTSDHRVNIGVYHHSVESVIRGSKYLKAAQELLDEVVSVGNRTKRDKAKIIKESNGGGENDQKMNCGVELTTAQRHEIQMKKAKLNSMLYEVEQRYKQYHHEMQVIVTSLEQIAGTGSSKSYTHPAQKTILRQFRCLKHTISAQIKALSKSLGEEENAVGGKMAFSRLKFIDHHLRQQRALQQQQQQQLGIMENNDVWRPKRGLPERAVSVLRAWLFEHFLHPYPKDSDKHMLAKETGLTKGQVSNWFINARVRLWKPMVEDMYIEETKNQQTSPEDNNTTKPEARPDSQSQVNLPEKNLKKPRNEIKHDHSPINILSMGTETKPGADRTSKEFDVTFGRENYLLAGKLPDRFTYTDHRHQQIPSGLNLQGYHNNNFSLSLGPPPSKTYQQSNFLSHGSFEFGTGIEPIESTLVNGINSQDNASHPNISNYEILDFQKRKPFPAQLLHDHHFVA